MSPKPRLRVSGAKYVTLASIACLVASAAVMILLYVQAYFLPLLLLALLLLLPAVINLLLLIPRGKQLLKTSPATESLVGCEPNLGDQEEISAAATEQPEKVKFSARLRACCARAASAIGNFFVRKRTAVLATLVVIATVAVNVVFWVLVRGATYSGVLSYLIPVLLGILFVLFIVFGKWCKHRTPKAAEEGDDAEGIRYDIALLRNMQSAFALGRLAILPIAVGVVIKLIGLYDFSKWLVVILSVLFAYKTIFLLISLFVVLVRRELALAPEIAAPAPGVEGGDLGILTYLEKNTGISMRSLWSIQMIKKALPYAALCAVLLLWCVTGVVLVNSNQEGAHYRFGRLQEETLSPGLHFTLPWPLDKVEVYDTKTVNKMTVGYIAEGEADNFWTEAHGGEEYRLLLGGGNELVSVNLRVMYRISDLRSYLTSSASPELLMSSASYEIVTARTISSDLDAMLSTDRAVFAETFREELMTYMQKYNTGLEVVSVVLESIHPPVEIAEAYQALISAEIEAEKILLDAEAKASERVAWAWVDYDTEVAIANIEYYEGVADANAAVAEFMASVEADNAYSDEYRYYKYMQAVMKAYSNAKLIIVGDGVNTENIYIGSIGSGVAE